MQNRKQFITDESGQKISVILSIKEYNKLIEEIEMKDDIKAFENAKANDDGSRISLSDYLKKRNFKNGNLQSATQQKSRKTIGQTA